MSTPALAIQFSDAEMRLLQNLVYQECGMYFDARRTHFLQDRLQRRLRECRMDSFYSYYRLLISAAAGCSTGQEPYTIAMLVADALAYHQLRMPHSADTTWPKPLVPPPWKVEIPASDINYSVLRAGQEGIYNEHQMSSVDYSYRLRYFDKVGERYAVKKAIKEVIHFDFHNLKTEFLPQSNDIIFCRNVMMYFDEAEQRRLVEKFYRCLSPGGYLLVGHAESLLGLTTRFTMVYHDSGTAYKRIEVSP